MSHDEFDPQSGTATPGEGLAEAQIAAIEGAFAEHDRMLTRLRRELDDLRAQPPSTDAGLGSNPEPSVDVEERLAAIETRLDQQDQALRHVLQRLIAFFEREGPG